jgi:hypothetical protein
VICRNPKHEIDDKTTDDIVNQALPSFVRPISPLFLLPPNFILDAAPGRLHPKREGPRSSRHHYRPCRHPVSHRRQPRCFQRMGVLPIPTERNSRPLFSAPFSCRGPR